MATLASLKANILEIINTRMFSEEYIETKINLAISLIAGGVKSSFGDFLTPPLPQLFNIATINTATDAAYVSMPATFQRKLQFVANSGGSEIEIYNSMIEFAGVYPLMNGSGTISSVVEQGGNLYYQKIPTVSETLTLHFFRHPVDMTTSDDTPDGIPEHLQEPLLVNYVCKELFNISENSNIEKHTILFNDAVRLLEVTIPFDNRSLYLGD